MKALPPHGESDLAGVTLRLDAPRDAKMLGDLASMNERRLDQGGFVVAEIDGRVVAALPLAGGEPLVDYFVRTAHLVPLLELRAEQIRRARGPRPRRRLIARLIPKEER
jgi:hypothetical protein